MRDELPTTTTDMQKLPRPIRSALQWARHGSLTTRPYSPEAASLARSGQQGQTLVLFALFFTVILGMAALVLDQGLLRKTNLDLHNALDSGALAGVSLLKDDAVAAEKVAREYAQLNFPGGLPDADISVSFRCLIGVDKGAPRLTDVPAACDPGSGVKWTVDSDGSTAFAPCVPSQGDVCNVIVLKGPAERDYAFAPALGIESGFTATQVAAACKGLCGEPPEVPLDLVVIIDRTSSMNGVDTENARAAADSVRKVLDPDIQWLGLSLLGPSKLGQSCRAAHDSVIGNAYSTDLRRWVPIGLTGAGASFDSDYLSGTSKMALTIACFRNSSTGTDLADPMRMATQELETSGRQNAIHAILLLTDGQPNASTSATVRANSTYCAEAYQAAQATKAKGIEVYTVGFGLDGANDIACGGYDAWKYRTATDLLANMATNSVRDGGCPGTENDDGDNYFCLPKTAGASTDLSKVFERAVAAMVSHSRLVKVPEDA